jgi:hypothetical protein
MAKAKAKRGGRRGGFTLPLAAIMGFAPMFGAAMKDYKAGGAYGAAAGLSLRTTGWDIVDQKWRPEYLLQGLGPVFLGMMVHKMAGRMGINRALANAGIPLLRL